MLIETQQVVGEAHRQERALGGIEVPHAEAIGLQVVLELLDVLFDAGALVVVAPEFGPVTLAISHKHAERVTLHIDETPPHSILVFPDSLTNGKELSGFGPQ